MDEIREFKTAFERGLQQVDRAGGNSDLQDSLDTVTALTGLSDADSFGSETRIVGRLPQLAFSDEEDKALDTCESVLLLSCASSVKQHTHTHVQQLCSSVLSY